MTYLEKQRLYSQIKFWGIFFVVFLFAILVLSWSVPRIGDSFNELGIDRFVFGIGMFLFGMFVYWFTSKCGYKLAYWAHELEKQISSFSNGIKGEEIFNESLKEHLKPNSVVLRSIDTGYGDVDFLIIDPRGVFVVEVKHYSGAMYVEENYVWRTYQSGDTRIKDSKSPFKQVQRLKSFVSRKLALAKVDPKHFVAVVAFSGNAVDLKERPSHVWVCNGGNNLDRSLVGLLNRPVVLSNKEINDIKEVFSAKTIESKIKNQINTLDSEKPITSSSS